MTKKSKLQERLESLEKERNQFKDIANRYMSENIKLKRDLITLRDNIIMMLKEAI